MTTFSPLKVNLRLGRKILSLFPSLKQEINIKPLAKVVLLLKYFMLISTATLKMEERYYSGISVTFNRIHCVITVQNQC